jgi:uncharacterized glyoxalase superfamily metalloenzyme YdcJ
MRQATVPIFIAGALATAVAAAQTAPPAPQAQQAPSRSAQVQVPPPAQDQGQDQSRKRSAQSAATETRPDARYPRPAGQDSQPDNSSHKTRVAAADSKKGTGTANNRGPKASDQTRPVRKLAERKAYTGNSGSKADPSTACSTSRPTQDGGVNCGTSGNSATEGKVVTKPR